MAETITQGLIDRPITPLRICPLSLAVRQSAIVTEKDVDFCNCIGPQCHLWQFEPGSDARTGDCSFNIAAASASVTAHLMNRMFNSPAAQSAEPQQN